MLGGEAEQTNVRFGCSVYPRFVSGWGSSRLEGGLKTPSLAMPLVDGASP